MALTISITIDGTQAEKKALLEALNWSTPKQLKHVPDPQDEGRLIQVVDNPLEGLDVDQATYQYIVTQINSMLEGHVAWKRIQPTEP